MTPLASALYCPNKSLDEDILGVIMGKGISLFLLLYYYYAITLMSAVPQAPVHVLIFKVNELQTS